MGTTTELYREGDLYIRRTMRRDGYGTFEVCRDGLTWPNSREPRPVASVETYPEHEAFGSTQPPQINWSGIGSVNADMARVYAKAIEFAAEAVDPQDGPLEDNPLGASFEAVADMMIESTEEFIRDDGLRADDSRIHDLAALLHVRELYTDVFLEGAGGA